MTTPIKPVAPIKLTWKNVEVAARKAYQEGRLAAQNRREGDLSLCQYRDRDLNPCAVGAAISDEDFRNHLRYDNNMVSVTELAALGIVSFPKKSDRFSIGKLQMLHDSWLTMVCNGDTETANRMESLFCKMLGIEPNQTQVNSESDAKETPQ